MLKLRSHVVNSYSNSYEYDKEEYLAYWFNYLYDIENNMSSNKLSLNNEDLVELQNIYKNLFNDFNYNKRVYSYKNK